MPATYSINVGTPTEALRKQDINSVLLDLPDNTQKLISPKDVRDAFLSAWATSAFKQTIGQANIEYLGIDSGDPSNRDIKEKIFIGKRNYAGGDIMSNSLLNNTNNDIYFYNTKSDLGTQSTKIVILSGTDSTLHTNAPYIESNSINSNTALDLNLVNPSLFSGPINIVSNTGRVAINGITFPTLAETSASASNGRILKYSGAYPNGVLKWAEPTVSIANIGTIGSPTNIYGSPSNVNGHSLEFVDPSIVPQTIGGVVQGSSFSAGSYQGQNWPLSEVIRKILYPYVPPALTLSVSFGSNNYFAAGLTTSAVFSYSITRYSNVVSGYEISGTTYSGLSFSGSVGSQLVATFSSNIYKSSDGTQSYILSARDNNNVVLTFSHSATASAIFVNPFFYGFSLTNIDLNGGSSTTRATQLGTYMNSASRIIVPYLGPSQSISAKYIGGGYLYFVVPNNYPIISKIKDPNGFIIHDSSSFIYSAFTYSNAGVAPIGANNIASGPPQWKIYKTLGTCSYTGSGNFEFIF